MDRGIKFAIPFEDVRGLGLISTYSLALLKHLEKGK